MARPQYLRRVINFLLSPLRTKSNHLVSANTAVPALQRELVDKEVCPGYHPKYFYPANSGELLANKYQILTKIGWGTRSTVWLARDVSRYIWQPERTVALKIINNHDPKSSHHERAIEELVAQRIPSHRGNVITRTCLESFEVAGPEGRHLCLVYEPMREPLWILQRRFDDHRLLLPIAKAYIYFCLVGLDYLHTECKVAHTDLTLGNILMSFENEQMLSRFVEEQVNSVPMLFKTDPVTGRNVYRCHNDFGPLDWKDLKNVVSKIADFGLSKRLDSAEPGSESTGTEIGISPIQPDHYRAPEVILGCGWDFRADIWNFGTMVWSIIERTELFQQVHNIHGQYDAKLHLAEMIALLGPPPKRLLARSDAMARYGWPNAIENEEGKLCSSAEEYFDGPFFDHEGNFLHSNFIPDRSFADRVTSLEEGEKELFLSFMKDMLAWLPEDRKVARELAEHPFLRLTRR